MYEKPRRTLLGGAPGQQGTKLRLYAEAASCFSFATLFALEACTNAGLWFLALPLLRRQIL